MLGPFPMTPFQSGKYFSTFKKFVGRISPVPGIFFENRFFNLLQLFTHLPNFLFFCCFYRFLEKCHKHLKEIGIN